MKHFTNLLPFTLLGILIYLYGCQDGHKVYVDTLKCEFLTDPLGLDIVEPRLSWEIHAEERNVLQESYRILVASSMERLNRDEGDLWDSQEVTSDQSVNVVYKGKALKSRMMCYWKVKVSTNKGMSEWSEPATWSMGLINPSEWTAKWIGYDKTAPSDVLIRKTRLAARYFRKDFTAANKLRKATLYISGLGLYEAYLNGERIGDDIFAPTPTDYTKSVKYNTYDVTALVRSGENAMGVVVGNGRFFNMRTKDDKSYPPLPPTVNYGFPKLIAQLELEFHDGSRQAVITDESWKVTADGPILANNEYDGEEYDARKEMKGWSEVGFDAKDWKPVDMTSAPTGRLEAQTNENIKVMEVIRPQSVTELAKGVYIIDMGQNMVGWLKIKVKGKSNDEIKLRYAEVLDDKGALYLANIRNAAVTDKYFFKGNGWEEWQPSFTYHGFRFVELSGLGYKPSVEDFEGKVIYDKMATIGHFESSDTTLNQIYKNAYWGIRGNYRGMPTDCPQRDERMGWLGDRATGSLGESFIFDNHNLYAKWLDDIEQAQLESGSIPDVAPAYWRFYNDNMTWPGAYLIIANMLYEQFGDVRPIVKHYASMKKWVYFMRDHFLKDNLMPRDLYGDWCMPPESPELIHSADPSRKTDGTLLGTSFYYHMLTLLERFATLQHLSEDAKEFQSQAALVKKAYNTKFFNTQTARYSNNTVTANLLSLRFGLVLEGYESDVFENIVRKTEKEFNGHVSTGLVGIQWLMRGLSNYGRSDLAYRIATNRDYPSWGYMIENGATTIWELWNGNTADPSMNSHNHVMLLGDLIVWFYEYLGGIRHMPGSVAYKKILLRPEMIDGLNYVNVSYHSLQGQISSYWTKQRGKIEWQVVIPANTTAEVYFPVKDKSQILEGNTPVEESKDVRFLRYESGCSVLAIGSGEYFFKTR